MMNDQERLSRETLAGWDRDRLEGAIVAMPGAGVGASNVMLTLALAHVGEVRCVDFDRYDASNLSRVPLAGRGEAYHGQVGKAEELMRAALAVHGAPRPTLRHAFGKIEGLGYGAFEGANVIVNGTDSFAIRAYLSDAARCLGIPFVDLGFHGTTGHAAMFPNRREDEACWRCLNPTAIVGRASCSLYARAELLQARVPSTQPIAAAVAAYAAHFVIEAIHGRLPETPIVTTVSLDRADAIRLAVTRAPSCSGRKAIAREIEDLAVDTSATASALFGELALGGIREPVLLLRREILVEAPCGRCGAPVKVMRALADVEGMPLCAGVCGEEGEAALLRVVDEIPLGDSLERESLKALGFAPRDVLEVRDEATACVRAYRLAGSIDDLFETLRRRA